MIELGRFEMDTWYYSPYPEPFASQQRLLICEFCLKYFRKKKTLLRHLSKCCPTHPPGDEIYRSPPPSDRTPANASVNPAIAMFEVDGNKNKVRLRRLYKLPACQRCSPADAWTIIWLLAVLLSCGCSWRGSRMHTMQ